MRDRSQGVTGTDGPRMGVCVSEVRGIYGDPSVSQKNAILQSHLLFSV